MPQATDIILNNAGYMISPGSPQSPGYKRLQDGYAEGLTQRTSITDFFGGQLRTHQLERDTVYTSTAVGPALGGQGITPWGYQGTLLAGNAPAVAVAPTISSRIPYVIVRDHVYFALGKQLWRGPHINGGTWGWSLVNTYPNDITDLTIYGSIGILIAFGAAADILFRHTQMGTESVLFTAERAHRIEAFNGYAVWIDARAAATPTILRMVKGTGIDSRHVSYDVQAMAPVGGELKLITKQALFSFRGRVRSLMVPNPAYTPGGTQPPQIPGEEWSGEFDPFYQDGMLTQESDFRFFEGYGGRTLAWIAGGVQELVPSGDRAGWRSTGLTGRRCFGGCVTAGYVLVSIESHQGTNDLWAYNGNGWWRIASKPMPPNGLGVWVNPIPAGRPYWGMSAYVFTTGATTTLDTVLLEPYQQGNGSMAYPMLPNAQLVTPLIDTGDRDKIKAWRKVGAVFSSPERHNNLDSNDQLQVILDYSTNSGVTWNQAASRTLTANTLANMNVDLEASLAGVTSRFIMLRVRWTSVTDWAPVLTGLWVEHEALHSPARRRKWNLRIHARDQEIDRDGVMLNRTGRQLIEELWTAWETDAPLTFRDIDYDADPVQRTVRIVGISEAATQPYDNNRWGDSNITLNLVEV